MLKNNIPYQDPGSFRDPAGSVFVFKDYILRLITQDGKKNYESIRHQPAVIRAIQNQDLIPFKEFNQSKLSIDQFPDAEYVIEHPKLSYLSYPYEWSFSLLKAAALHHLNLQLFLLSNNIVLSDATAYNVQFIGPKPIFIDFLSLIPYQNGQYWTGYRQFCEQFLNPLLLSSVVKTDYFHWYRGSLEGISSKDLKTLIPFTKISWNVLIHVILQAKLENKPINKLIEDRTSRINAHFSKNAYYGLLYNLKNWISNLQPHSTKNSIWKNYSLNNTYQVQEINLKKQFVEEFIQHVKPKILVDLGCNSGDYSIVSLKAGAQYVVGFDSDHAAIEQAYTRAKTENLNFLPLILDATNPSPNQGWQQLERPGFMERTKADALLMLAFQHHLRITKNIPIKEIVAWFLSIAPVGIVEFVPKTDSTVQHMLSSRKDIFADYEVDNFERILTSSAKIIAKKIISKSGRCLFWYERHQ